MIKPTNGAVNAGTRLEEKALTVSQALNRFVEDYIWQHGFGEKTANNYQWALNSFIKANGDLPIAQVTQEHIKSWRRYMEHNQYTVGATNAFLYRMRKFLSYSSKTIELAIDPSEIVIPKKNKPIPNYLTQKEVDLLIKAADTRGKAIISLLYASGIRVGELVKLRTKDISGDMLKIRGKGGVERIVFMDDRAKKYLHTYQLTRQDNCQYLFSSRKCKGLALKPQQIQINIRAFALKAGIDKRVTPHVLRHSFATHMIQAGCGAFHLQKMLGHADISTTQIYVHLGSADLKLAYKKFHGA